ncbi:hypothetical protein JRQ81_005685 [Phrynocephalus forsythii]|uniref:Uncharacterized protein n=1 Tax=Phrynocephalus forsythii TaxID=171643 RepID=A0A9Q0Y331_9SAUR|nr:hypothetical protein JRQ81_005685 [Phrynocephalus forsythii]
MGRRRSCTMLRKIHAIFHPSSRRRHLSDGIPAGDGSAVRLIRSTSMYVLEEPKLSESLKKSKSSTSLDSVACLQLKEEEKTWMHSKTQDCLQYLQDLLALRKKYIESIKDLKSLDRTSQMSPLSTKSSNARKNPPLPTPPVQSSKISAERKVSHFNAEVTEAIAYFDTIIAELDAERHRKIIVRDYPHADVDFDAHESTVCIPTGSFGPLGDIPRIPPQEQRPKVSNLKEATKEEQSAPERNSKDIQYISRKLWREPSIHGNLNPKCAPNNNTDLEITSNGSSVKSQGVFHMEAPPPQEGRLTSEGPSYTISVILRKRFVMVHLYLMPLTPMST